MTHGCMIEGKVSCIMNVSSSALGSIIRTNGACSTNVNPISIGVNLTIHKFWYHSKCGQIWPLANDWSDEKQKTRNKRLLNSNQNREAMNPLCMRYLSQMVCSSLGLTEWFEIMLQIPCLTGLGTSAGMPSPELCPSGGQIGRSVKSDLQIVAC